MILNFFIFVGVVALATALTRWFGLSERLAMWAIGIVVGAFWLIGVVNGKSVFFESSCMAEYERSGDKYEDRTGNMYSKIEVYSGCASVFVGKAFAEAMFFGPLVTIPEGVKSLFSGGD